jgi:hypothetical protein
VTTPRKLRPRETAKLAVAPVTVTDRTCALVFGLEARQWCEWLDAADVPHTKIGRRTIALVADCVAALSRSAARTTDAPTPIKNDELQSVDDVLGALGLKRAS